MRPPLTTKPLLGTISITLQLNDTKEELALQELRTGPVKTGCGHVRRDPHTDIFLFALRFPHAAAVEPYVLHSSQRGAMPEFVTKTTWW